jgi:hypothetical protein
MFAEETPSVVNGPMLLVLSRSKKRVYRPKTINKLGEAERILSEYGLEPNALNKAWAPPFDETRKVLSDEQSDQEAVNLALNLFRYGHPNLTIRPCPANAPETDGNWVAGHVFVRRMHALQYDPEKDAFVISYDTSNTGHPLYYWGPHANRVSAKWVQKHGVKGEAEVAKWRKRMWRKAIRTATALETTHDTVTLGEPVFSPFTWSQLEPAYVASIASTIGVPPAVAATSILSDQTPVPKRAFATYNGEVYSTFVPNTAELPCQVDSLTKIAQNVQLFNLPEAMQKKDGIVFNGESVV